MKSQYVPGNDGIQPLAIKVWKHILIAGTVD